MWATQQRHTLIHGFHKVGDVLHERGHELLEILSRQQLLPLRHQLLCHALGRVFGLWVGLGLGSQS